MKSSRLLCCSLSEPLSRSGKDFYLLPSCPHFLCSLIPQCMYVIECGSCDNLNWTAPKLVRLSQDTCTTPNGTFWRLVHIIILAASSCLIALLQIFQEVSCLTNLSLQIIKNITQAYVICPLTSKRQRYDVLAC